MPGMKDEEIGAFLTEFKRVFPEATLESITIQGENGLMSMIKFTKDEVGESTGGDFELIPDGKYTAQIANHEWKSTKAGGHMLALTLEITGPTHEGRKLWDNLNIDCNSEDAQKIALRSYKAICMACNAEAFYDGIFEVDENSIDGYLDAIPENLYGNDLQISVGVEKGKDGYRDKNKIKAYGAPTATATTAKPSAATNGKAKPSWAK